MDLAQRSRQFGDFYVPTYKVRVNGRDLRTDLAVAVSQVEADLSLDMAGTFSFTVVNSYDNKTKEFKTGLGSELLEETNFGAEVEIDIGYGSSPPLLISGVISNITTNFPQDGAPELIISGKDHFFPLTLGKKTQSWSNVRDSDVVRRIASEHNLDPQLQLTDEVHKQIEQNQESDLAFIGKLARRNHFDYFIVGRQLFFQRPSDTGDGVVQLNWGTSLLSFSPQANLSGQFSRVEVRGWDPKQKKAIVGVANAGQESGRDAGRRSGPQQVAATVKETPVFHVRQPVLTQAEANIYAKALLDDCAKKHLTGDGESIGFPELRPGRNVVVTGLGQRFSKTYYVEKAKHRADVSGYRTTFHVKESTL